MEIDAGFKEGSTYLCRSLFLAIERLAILDQVTPLYRTIWRLEIFPWMIVVNAHSYQAVIGATYVPAYHVYLSQRGIPIALANPFSIRSLSGLSPECIAIDFLCHLNSCGYFGLHSVPSSLVLLHQKKQPLHQ